MKVIYMFLSRETDLQLCQIYTKINIYTILYNIKVVGLKISNSANMQPSENEDIPEKANCNLGLLQF